MARSGSPSDRPPRKRATKPDETPISWDERLVDALIVRRREVAGVLLILFALTTLLALTGLTQAGWLTWWTRLLRQIFGWGAFVLCLASVAVGTHLIVGRLKRSYPVQPSQIFGLGRT